MRRSLKNLKTNLSISEMLDSYDFNNSPETINPPQKFGLHKSQLVSNKRLTKKRLAAANTNRENIEQFKAAQSKLSDMHDHLAQKNKQIEDNKILKNKLYYTVNMLMLKLRKRESHLAALTKTYKQARIKIKTLEDRNLAHKRAIKIYRDELKSKDLQIETLRLKKSKIHQKSKSGSQSEKAV